MLAMPPNQAMILMLSTTAQSPLKESFTDIPEGCGSLLVRKEGHIILMHGNFENGEFKEGYVIYNDSIYDANSHGEGTLYYADGKII